MLMCIIVYPCIVDIHCQGTSPTCRCIYVYMYSGPQKWCLIREVHHNISLMSNTCTHNLKEEERKSEEESARRRAKRQEGRRKKKEQRLAVVADLKSVAVQRRGEAQRLLQTLLAGAAEERSVTGTSIYHLLYTLKTTLNRIRYRDHAC